MKRTLLLIFALISVQVIIARPVSVQNILEGANYTIAADTLELYDTIGNKINNGTITIYGSDPNVDVLAGYIWVKNTTDTPMLNVFVRRVVNQEVEGSQNSFCFGINCYGPMTNESTIPTEIAAGVTDKSFYGDYYPNQHGGLTSITYEFFDNVTFGVPVMAKATVNFHISANSIAENKVIFKGPYPNPASQYTNFEYNIPSVYDNAQLIIRNMLGVEVSNVFLNKGAGKESIDVSNYASGIYFYTLVVDGKVIQSKKMIVKH
jgi:hypothetical protein